MKVKTRLWDGLILLIIASFLIIPLALTLMCYYLLAKKGWTPIKCILLLLVIGIFGCIFGIWAGSYTALIPVPWHA